MARGRINELIDVGEWEVRVDRRFVQVAKVNADANATVLFRNDDHVR